MFLVLVKEDLQGKKSSKIWNGEHSRVCGTFLFITFPQHWFSSPPGVRYGDVKDIGMYTFPMGTLELQVWPFVLPPLTIKIAQQLSVLFNSHQRPLVEHGSDGGDVRWATRCPSFTSVLTVEGRTSGTVATIDFLIMELFTYSRWAWADPHTLFGGKCTSTIIPELPEKQHALTSEWARLYSSLKCLRASPSGDSRELAGIPEASLLLQFAGERSKLVNILGSNKHTFPFDTKCTIWGEFLKKKKGGGGCCSRSLIDGALVENMSRG